MKTLTFTLLASLLGYADNRPVKNWCKRNGVKYIKDGKFYMVLEEEFNRKRAEQFESLEKKLDIVTPVVIFGRYIPKSKEAQSLADQCRRT